MLPISDLSARIAGHRQDLNAAFDRVMASGWVVMGSEVARFERDFAHYLGARHCIGVGNGTDALIVALQTVGVREGDRVATAANAGMYAATAMLSLRALPVFMDSDSVTCGTTVPEIQRALDAGVRAVVVTHLYGRANPDVATIADLCRRAGVALVEDCAQAHGARVGGRCAGTFGSASAFSFYPTKNLGALGDGGAVVTQDESIARDARLLRQYGWTDKYLVSRGGARNSRLDELQAAFLNELLPYLDDWNARRRKIARRYLAGIRNPALVLPPQPDDADVAHLFVVRSPLRDSLRAHLLASSIRSDVHFPIPDHRQPVFGDQFAGLELESTERLAREALTLPCFPEMTDEQVDGVVRAVNDWRP